MVRFKTPFRLAAFLAGAAFAAQGSIIANFSDEIIWTDPSMTGRISRNGIDSEWSVPKGWPGIQSGTTSTTFNYTQYDYPVITNGNYFQVDIYDPNSAVFAAAYQDSFTPAPGPTSTNYLGDPGDSGGSLFFQVYVPTSHSLDLVINNVLSLGQQYSVVVEEYSDTQFDDPAPGIPEPASIALTLGGLAGLILARRRLASGQ